ncbi:MurR/RpiR family transcriptional regulator [Marivita hallyeonensis]|uniref:Transcriptional regulator, RpiR family n=1 Tax=Marivita hallyeonensis TaxID=996342 RepID=A0A1M5X2M9_9RHOB|nr:MurR/RpiR family transcriptional regulator [Marivita hallyeonensis]SHH93842.1 transcriptional regulator, RpiR family [Marivita hallyeonensis]
MTVRSTISAASDSLTQSERKLAATILSNYPFKGLLNIQELAEEAGVSAASISRFTAKLGLDGYADMQRKLLEELRRGDISPVDLHERSTRIEGSFLAGFLSRAAAQIETAGDAITDGQFDRITALLSDQRRQVFALGGRISDTIARHLTFHLAQSREGVEHMSRDIESWPGHLLRMRPGDVVFLVDFRRYEHTLERLAQALATKKVKIVLLTDSWISPIKNNAAEVLAVPIETGTVWDSYAAALAIVEALVARVAELTWDETRDRIELWDATRALTTETKT